MEVEKGNLVLTRKSGESVLIGRDVTVTVLHVRGDRVSLLISAPLTTSVHREELIQE